VALEKIQWLTTQNVQFVEQPLPAKNFDDMRKLYEQSPLPLFADEDCIIPSDLPQLMNCYHGINIKLVKCGGIAPAIQMIQTARTFSKQIMLGCMVESSAGIAPAAHLAGGADYLDLDGNLLLSNDPFHGPRAACGQFSPLVQPGLNVSQDEEIAWETLFTI
jgi:L-alanine-DL-glutamate epimerase-like enolase superfamily enzyme